MRALPAVLLCLCCLLLPPALATAETCQYETAWGVLTLQFNYVSSTFTGNYPHRNGEVAGIFQGNKAEGQWAQSDGKGSFVFTFHSTGFRGQWKNLADRNWRGAWNGQLKGCW